MKSSDTITLTYYEANLHDSKNDLRMNIGSPSQVAFYKKLQHKIKTFTKISRRCGVLGPADSLGDWPCCTLLPHATGQHSYRDLGTGKLVHWKGSKGGEYMRRVLRLKNVRD